MNSGTGSEMDWKKAGRSLPCTRKENRMKKLSLGVAVMVLLLTAAVGVAQETEDPATIWVSVPKVEGTWTGKWFSYFGGSGRIKAVVKQNGTVLKGTLRVTNTDCGTVSTNLNGSVSNTTAKFRAVFDCRGDKVVLKFTKGRLSSSGTKITGTYHVFVNDSLDDYGTFSANR